MNCYKNHLKAGSRCESMDYKLLMTILKFDFSRLAAKNKYRYVFNSLPEGYE